MVDVLCVLVVAEISVHHHLHQEVTDAGREKLNASGENPVLQCEENNDFTIQEGCTCLSRQ